MSRRRVFRAPGRVNLIGEHTDYNRGFVLPAALALDCRVSAVRRNDNRLTARSVTLQEERSWTLEQLEPQKDWGDYVAGVALELAELGIGPVAADLEIDSTIPIGAGLSSSAALEVAVALAICALDGASLDPVELAEACQRAESNFVGLNCGLMDQMIALLGRRNHALWLDCDTLNYHTVPLPAGCSLVMVNTMVKHELASSEYNRRRRECESAAARLGHSLREATLAECEKLPDLERRRARHVISENARVEQFVAACRLSDLVTAGRLMYASHASLRDDYEVSCPELDFLVEAARALEGVIGSRLTGGGFGGCTVNLVRAGSVAEFQSRISAAYRERFGVEPAIYSCATADGAGEIGASQPATR